MAKFLQIVPKPRSEDFPIITVLLKTSLWSHGKTNVTQLGKAAVEKWPESIQIVQMLHACSDHQATLNLLADFFVLKSPETLKKRINSLQFYMQFLDSINAPFPGSEALLYMFFCQLRDNGCVPSRMKGILEALSFTMYVFEIPSLEPLCKSRRCHGVASRKSNGPSRQADPLKVAELRCIHECLQDEVEDLWNRLAAGAILFAVYSRSRWSDLQHACKLEADVDDHGTCAYLEATVREFKTSSSAAFRNHFLSVVAPAVGVTNDNWAKTWMQVREDMMLDSIAQVPIMPAPDADGRATVRPIRTTEIGRWCEFILTKQGLELGDRKIRSHSFKCTTLSFAAKFGGNLDDRLILGGHVMPFRSVVTYSRDTIAGPIRFLERILLAIRNNSFFPDRTRSGRFTAETARTEAIEVHSDSEQPAGHALSTPESTNSSSGDVGTTDTSSSDEGASHNAAKQGTLQLHPPEGTFMVQHKKLRTVHLMRNAFTDRFVCNRVRTDAYDEPGKLTADTPTCRHCWKQP